MDLSMLAVRVTACLVVPIELKDKAAEKLNQAMDQLVIDGVPVFDTSVECEPICTDDEDGSAGNA